MLEDLSEMVVLRNAFIDNAGQVADDVPFLSVVVDDILRQSIQLLIGPIHETSQLLPPVFINLLIDVR